MIQTSYAALSCFPPGREPDERQHGAAQALLRAGRLYHVKTVLSSGNVVFSARDASEAALVRKAETAMAKHLGRSFRTIVRPIDHPHALDEADPYAGFRLPPTAKRVVTLHGEKVRRDRPA